MGFLTIWGPLLGGSRDPFDNLDLPSYLDRVSQYCWWFRNPKKIHLGWIKELGVNYHINWCRNSEPSTGFYKNMFDDLPLKRTAIALVCEWLHRSERMERILSFSVFSCSKPLIFYRSPKQTWLNTVSPARIREHFSHLREIKRQFPLLNAQRRHEHRRGGTAMASATWRFDEEEVSMKWDHRVDGSKICLTTWSW